MEIIPFDFNDYNIRTFTDKNGEIWFIAQDISKVLEIKNISDAVKDFDSDEKDIVLNDTLGGKQEMLVLSESGLYSLLIRSRKPVARPFQKWLTKKVLPSIRKTGKYELENSQSTQPVQTSQTLENIDLDLQISQNKKLLEFIELINSQTPKNLFFLDKIYKNFSEKSPLDLFGIDLDSHYFIPTELGKFLNKSAVEINKILEHKELQFKENGEWFLTKKGENFGFKFQNGKFKTFKTIKWKLEVIF